MRFLLGLWMALIVMSPPASAETRIALIIGNSGYADPHWPTLPNPVNDATAMQRALKNAGFDTVTVLNAKRRDFYRAVDEFSEKIARDPDAVGLFYYAGHGVQADGINYLIPVDAEIESGSDLEANAFDTSRVLHAMKTAQNRMNMVILDACRDNPLPKVRGATRGLAKMDAPSGTFIAYAAAPGQEARDGAKGTNGVFTGELVKAMAEPGMPLEQMFKKVIAGVVADTQGKQEPWSEASIRGDFYFHVTVTPGPPGAAPSSMGPDSKQIELTFWQSIKESNDAADFRAYLAQFPNGIFAALAVNRMNFLHPVAPADSKPAVEAVAAVPSKLEPVSLLLAKANVLRGAQIARQCQACHDFVKGGPDMVGPNLWGIIGGPAAHRPEYQYSTAMAKYIGVWTYESLNKFIANPREFLPGTRETFAGLKNVQDRADLLAWLRLQENDPIPLPTETN